MSQKFSLGHVVATPGALEALRDSNEDAASYLAPCLGRLGRGWHQ
jgi:hypothetical protein